MPDFRALRSRASHDAVLFAFDLLLHEDDDLRDLALISRKQRLARLIGKAKQNAIRFVEHLTDDGAVVFEHACRMGLEGIVTKRVDAPYRVRRIGHCCRAPQGRLAARPVIPTLGWRRKKDIGVVEQDGRSPYLYLYGECH